MMPPMVTRAGTQHQRATKYNNFRSGEITALTYHLKRRVLLEVVKLLSQLNVSKIVQRETLELQFLHFRSYVIMKITILLNDYKDFIHFKGTMNMSFQMSEVLDHTDYKNI